MLINPYLIICNLLSYIHKAGDYSHLSFYILLTVTKVSYKININKHKHECKGAHDWHGIKKLSLENGDNMDVVSEQLVWQMAKLADDEGLFGDHYKPGLANLVKLTFEIVPEHEDLHSYDGHVEIEEAGVYVNAEQGKFLVYCLLIEYHIILLHDLCAFLSLICS